MALSSPSETSEAGGSLGRAAAELEEHGAWLEAEAARLQAALAENGELKLKLAKFHPDQ